jgi:phosphoserine phosphatase
VLAGIVSTGLSLLAERVRRELRLDHAVANEIVLRDGAVTGEVIIRVPHGGKGAALAEFCGAFGLVPGEVAAVGDTEGDLAMFRAAGWSVAFNATDPAVLRSASEVAPGGDLRALVDCLLPRGG